MLTESLKSDPELENDQDPLLTSLRIGGVPVRRQLRLRSNPSWDEQQLARSLAALHVGMGPGRIRQWIFATNPDSELPFRDPVKQLRRAGAQEFRRMENRRIPTSIEVGVSMITNRTLTRGSFRHRRRLLLRS